MSKLKVAALQGLSASSDAITLANDGTCTANITNNLSNRNKIINGEMAVAQRGTSFAAASEYTVDRFRISKSNDGAVTVTQSSTTPDGFANSLKVDVTTADTSIAASQYLQLSQRIEAQNLQDLAYGTSSAKTITISFWVRSNVTGTYTFALQQPDNSSKQVSQTYTIDSADTWEKKTFTFAGDTSGVINNDTGNGMHVYWNLSIGSTYTSGTSRSTWTSYVNGDFAAGHTANLLSSTSNEWYITGVQFEVGSVATDFEHRSYRDELARCQRYYYLHGTGAGNYGLQGTGMMGLNSSTITGKIIMWFPVPMRTKPSATYHTANEFRNDTGLAANDSTFGAIWGDATSVNCAWVDFPGGSGSNFGSSKAVMVYSRSGSSAKMAFSAEL